MPVEPLGDASTQLATMFNTLLLVTEPARHPHIIADFRRHIGERSHLNRLLRVVTHLGGLPRLGLAESVWNHRRLLNLCGNLPARTLLTGQLP